MRITGPLARAAARRTRPDDLWDDARFRAARELDLAEPLTNIRSVLRATVLCLALALLLTSGKLVEIADRQPLGADRDRWLHLAEGVDRVANFLSLNRPYDLVQELRGAGDAAGRRVDSIDEVATDAGLDPSIVGAPDVATVPTTTVSAASASSTTTTTAPPALRTVTAAHPLRVYVGGDSQAEFLGQAVATESGPRSLQVNVNYQISTSLARPDYFNWPAELAEMIENDDPEAVVLFVGANEYQDMEAGDGTQLVRGGEEWQVEWSRRLAITLDLLAGDHRHVFWVGQPPMRDGRVNEGVILINALAEPVVAARPDVTFVDIWDLFGGDGGYSERVTGSDGDEIRARVDDGVHLTRAAASWVSELVVSGFDTVWRFA
jgi:uncharacterized protein